MEKKERKRKREKDTKIIRKIQIDRDKGMERQSEGIKYMQINRKKTHREKERTKERESQAFNQ